MARSRLLVTAVVGAALCLGLLAGGIAVSTPNPTRPSFPMLAPLEPPSGSCTSGAMCQSAPSDPKPAAPAIRPTAKEPERTASLLFVGDLMFDRVVAERIAAADDSNYPFRLVASDPRFHDATVRVGNLEGPITAKRAPPVKELDFAFDPSVAAALKAMGFAAVSQANNHLLDQGRDGADESRRALESAGVTAFGDQVRDDARSATAYVDAGGWRVALLGFNMTDNPIDRNAAEDAIIQARKNADVVIVVPHWGTEYQATPDASSRDLAHWFIDIGVDAVIGSHPHWMQTVEVYRGSPIVYSLGNFVFDQDWSAETGEALAVTFELSASSRSLSLHPVRIARSQPRFLDGEDKLKRLKYLATLSDPALTDAILAGRLTLPSF